MIKIFGILAVMFNTTFAFAGDIIIKDGFYANSIGSNFSCTYQLVNDLSMGTVILENGGLGECSPAPSIKVTLKWDVTTKRYTGSQQQGFGIEGAIELIPISDHAFKFTLQETRNGCASKACDQALNGFSALVTKNGCN